MHIIAAVTLIFYILCVSFFISKYGVHSPSSLFFLALGFFQVSRLIYCAFPSLNHFLDGEDYTLDSLLLLTSIISFTLGHELFIKQGKAVVSTTNVLCENQVLFDIGKYIILASFLPTMIVAVESITSFSGSYGIDEGGPSPLQKIGLYSSTIGLQLINCSGHSISRQHIILISMVALPRLLLSFVSMRGYFLFFVLAEFSLLFITGQVNLKWAKVINTSIAGFLPLLIIIPLSTRSGLSISQLMNEIASVVYSFSDPITVINLANENINNIPKIIYSFSSVIALYFPFLGLEDYYISASENPLGEGIMVNRLDRALSKYLLWDRGMKFAGTGGNYIADLNMDGGFVGVMLGSALLGRVVKIFEDTVKNSRLVLFLAFYFLQKLIYLPRGTYTELFDMLPIYSLIFIIIVFISKFLPTKT